MGGLHTAAQEPGRAEGKSLHEIQAHIARSALVAAATLPTLRRRRPRCLMRLLAPRSWRIVRDRAATLPARASSSTRGPTERAAPAWPLASPASSRSAHMRSAALSSRASAAQPARAARPARQTGSSGSAAALPAAAPARAAPAAAMRRSVATPAAATDKEAAPQVEEGMVRCCCLAGRPAHISSRAQHAPCCRRRRLLLFCSCACSLPAAPASS